MKLRSIELLRGLAALSVAISHGTSMLVEEAASPFRTYHDGFRFPGCPGVECFFVISGFVLTMAHRSDLGDPRRSPSFLWRRLCRIYPCHWLVLGWTIWRYLGWDGITPANVADWALLGPTSTFDPVSVAWTLRQEMTFYLIFGLLLIPLGRWFLLAWFAVVLGWTLAAPADAASGPAETVAHFVFNVFAVEFLAGAAAALLLARSPLPGRWGGAVALGGVALVAARLSVDHWGLEYGGLNARLIYGAGYAAVLFGLASLERSGALRLGRFAAAAGAISYPLYLSHTTTISYVQRALGSHGRYAAIGPDVTVALLIAASILVGAAIAALYDQPMQRALRRVPRLVAGRRAASGTPEDPVHPDQRLRPRRAA